MDATRYDTIRPERMDRSSFLRAQPFLFPIASSVSWPPPLPAETSERSSCRKETLLRDFWLSIEPLPCPSWEDRERSLSQQSITTSRGPAFFTSSSKCSSYAAGNNQRTDTIHKDSNFDPAMCPIEVCVHSATLTLPSQETPAAYVDIMSASFSNRFTSPTAYQKLLFRQQHRRQQSAAESLSHNHRIKPQLRESTIFLKIDQLVYQMDLSHVENVDIQSGESNDHTSIQEDSKSGHSRPPSLLIQFGNACIFRIFSMKGVTANNLSALQGFHHLLVQLLTADDQVPSEFPHPYFIGNAFLASPAGSSSNTTVGMSSSQEPGQRDFSRPTETPPSSRMGGDPNPSATSKEGSGDKAGGSLEGTGEIAGPTSDGAPEASSKPQPQPQDGKRRSPVSPSTNSDQVSFIRIRQAAYEQSKRDLGSLNDLLILPSHSLGCMGQADHEKDRPEKRLRVLQDQANELLNSVPDNLSVSYCTQSQLQEAIQRQNDRIHELELELDGLVNSFWPAPTRSTGAIGTTGLSSLQPSTFRRSPQIESSECIKRANDLLQKHKEAIEEKVALLTLPTRGS